MNSTIPSHLARILDRKREEVQALRPNAAALRARAADAEAPRGFAGALEAPDGPHLIAELKKASPSKGVIRADYDPAALARRYRAGGASCLSCLTDRDFFQGDLAHLVAARTAVDLPVLRKDFVVDSLQLVEARAHGADAILLIVAALASSQLVELHEEAKSLRMDVLLEVHTEGELERCLAAIPAPRLLGVNNRDLNTFATDLATTERLAPMVPRGTLLIGESSIESREDVLRLARSGVKAVLVGESLMRHSDPGAAAAALLGREEAR